MRFDGLSKEAIVAGGDFLNYSITWDEAERVFTLLSGEPTVSSEVAELFALHGRMSKELPRRGTAPTKTADSH